MRGKGGKGTELRQVTRWRDRNAVNKAWGQTYRKRMTDGLEHCRNCGTSDNLTFGHLIPASAGVALSMANATILCRPCNAKQGVEFWPHLTSLASEEHDAPPDRRWAELALAERKHLHVNRMHEQALAEDQRRGQATP